MYHRRRTLYFVFCFPSKLFFRFILILCVKCVFVWLGRFDSGVICREFHVSLVAICLVLFVAFSSVVMYAETLAHFEREHLCCADL